MLYKTKGVVLGYIKYSDTSIIVKIYTEEFGLQTYIVNGVRSKSSKNKIALFQPLTLLDLVVYHKENKDINRISELKCSTVFHSIPFNQRKIGMAIFLAEVLSKTLKEHFHNKELFELIVNTISYLDEIDDKFENLHLQFMIQVAAFLGFSPGNAQDIIEEIRITLTLEETQLLELLMTAAPHEYIKINNQTRRKLLDCILRYFSLHVENFGTLNSVAILQEIYND